MSWSWRRSAPSTTQLLMPLRSSVTVPSAFVLLPLRDEIAPVFSDRRPGRSLPMYPAMGTGRQPVQEVVDGGLAVAHRGQHVVGPGIAQLGRGARHLVAGQQRGGVQPVLLGLPLEHLASELDGARALLDLQPLVDLAPRP